MNIFRLLLNEETLFMTVPLVMKAPTAIIIKNEP
jgi:hypothetical protein